MVNVGAIIATLGLNNAQFIAGLKQSEGALAASAAKMASIGKTLTLGLTVPLVAVAAATTKVSTDFNKSMAEISTLIPGATARVDELKYSIQELAMETGKSTGDLAGGMYEVISAFGDASDSMEKLELASKAATAGISSTQDAIKLASAVMKAYGDTSADMMAKVYDLSFQTVKLGQTTFPELASAMQQVTGLAVNLGVEVEELFGVFATLTGVTGDASKVSTQLRGILNGFLKPTEELSAAISGLGYSTADAMIEEKGLIGALQAVIGTTDGTKEAVAELFANIRALTGIFPLVSTQAETFDQKLKAMYESTGAMDEAYEEYIHNNGELSHSFEVAKQMMVVFAQRLGDALAPAIQSLIRALNNHLLPALLKLVDAFTKLPEGVQSAVLAIGAFAVALGPTLWIGAKFITMGKGIIGVAKGISAAFGAVSTAVGVSVTALAGAAAAIGAVVYAYADLTKRGIGTSGEGIETLPAETQMLMTGGATTSYGMPMATVGDAVEEAVSGKDRTTRIVQRLGDGISSKMSDMVEKIKAKMPDIETDVELYVDHENIIAISEEVQAEMDKITIQLEADIQGLNKQTGEQLASYTTAALESLQSSSEAYREKFDIMSRAGGDFAKELSKGIYDATTLEKIGLSPEEIEQFQNTRQYQNDAIEQYRTIQQTAMDMARDFADGKKLSEEQLNSLQDYYAQELQSAADYASSLEGLISTANGYLAEIASKDTNVNVTVNVSSTGTVSQNVTGGTVQTNIGEQDTSDTTTHDLLSKINTTLKTVGTTAGTTVGGTAGLDLKNRSFF